MNEGLSNTRRSGMRRRVLQSACAFAMAAAVPVLARADLVGVLPQIKPSIVAVGTYQRTRSPAFQFRGTGFVVGDGHLIATNAHVLPETVAGENMETLAIVVPGKDQQGTVRQVSRVASERSRDLALLRLEGGAALPALSLASRERVQEGQEIAFTGFPIGAVLGMTPVTHRGIVSAITPIGIPQANSRDLNPALIRRLANDVFRVYQLDATAYPGNSGSPVFDPKTGEVIGVINMVFVKSTKESALSDPSGISYAIPVEYLHKLLGEVR
ncbi:S1 family peptidase [Thauera linaloolentis]|uniref:Peptidase S1 and S6 chymotrypsin/Hap n=1 Tax=Thauera linaloolentis (strain DSM 12138 / JCM 21573 / CCUG 41526 / CIP 105981 / IAM 15112 / NBRC 102519 / 47Lol) TaxID=1123367 RepID=N6ZC79_THAL4|nr:serine protease [Thauera linaloolentis]ENO89784.1 peptidase S1 and S6 chymotrypsin/Hap [Thauera linaloolentis 47Lol = DSM 12138]MCM8567027.1 serine protease [Thauera linaloolentis]